MKNKTYNFVISFGEACFTAILLRKLGLRTMSGPLDWCYGASFEERINLFLNDFENIFNKEDFTFKELDVSGKDAYTNVKTGITYNHDFPHMVDFDISFSEVFSKYKRRISKCLTQFSRGGVIVYIELPDSKGKIHSLDKLLEISEKINRKYTDKNIDILYVRHNDTLNDKEVIFHQLSDNVIFAECYNKSREINTPKFANNFKNSKECLKYIKVKNMFLNRLRYRLNKIFKKKK